MDLRDTPRFNSVSHEVFTISNYLGLFPYREGHEFLGASKLDSILLIFIMAPLVYFTSFYLDDHLYNMFKTHQTTIFSRTLEILYTGLVLMPPVSSLWLAKNAKQYLQILENLKEVGNITSYVPKRANFTLFYMLYIGQAIHDMYKCYSHGISCFKNPIVWIFQMFLVGTLLVILQIITLVRVIRSYYEYLLDTLKRSNAEKWAHCHELLESSCNSISHCYGPQLFIFFLSMFVVIVCNGFIVVDSFRTHDFRGLWFGAFRATFYSLNLFHIVYFCQETQVKAEKFDKLLYHLVVKDETKSLLNSKRIEMHFKQKGKARFSAMGFFKIDYPLICSMISSATTYIVILVQFSK